MKKVLTLLLVLLLCVTMGTIAIADGGKVVYKGFPDGFLFQPGSDYSVTDLFPDFKDVMPGDVLTQTVTVKNTSVNKVRMYMRSLGENLTLDGTVDFLKQLQLTVKRPGPGGQVLFDATADAPAGLKNWVYLGTILANSSVNLDLILTVPTSMDDRFQSAKGYLDWEFLAEEIPPDVIGPIVEIEKIDITVTKVWKDANGNIIDAPEGAVVNVDLVANSSITGMVKLSEENNWTHTFDGKPKVSSAGKDIVYEVIEYFDSEDWETEITGDAVNGFIITNIKKSSEPVVVETRDIKVTKLWKDTEGNTCAPPDGAFVTVALFANGGSGQTVILTDDNSWTYTFAKQPVYDSNGDKIIYTVAETTDDSRWNAQLSGDMDSGFVITNIRVPAQKTEYTDITVTKVWKDKDGNTVDALKDAYITIELNADDLPYTSTVLSDANGWTYTFKNVPKTDELGDNIAYTVKEYSNDADWISTVSGDAENGFTVTNTQKEDTQPVTPPTGDNTKLPLWIGMAIGSFVIMILFLILFFKKDREETTQQ